MKKQFKFFSVLFAAAAMAACSDDAPIADGNSNSSGNEGEGCFISLNIQLPTANGSRSQTTTGGQSTDGQEIGFAYENNVDKVIIVIANSTDNSYITHATVAADKLNPVTGQYTYRPIAKLEKTNISEFYKNNPTSRTVNVFVFCNPTSDLESAITETTPWYNATCTVLEGNGQAETNTSIWSKNSFLMSNIALCTREFPATIDEWNKYSTEASAFDLSGINSAGQDGEVDNSAEKGRGTVRVERNVARFDFRDGSKLGNNTYNVIYTLDANNKPVPLFNVQLDRMLLANEAKEFYYLPRVSNDGTLKDFNLCGSETNSNYIVGPNAADFGKTDLPQNFGKYFNYPFFGSNNESDYRLWTGSYINEVLGETEDNLTDKELADQYYVWRYVTENVIPAPAKNQTMGRTTMVVFKGRLLATEEALNSDDYYTRTMAEAIGDGTKDHPATISGVPTQDPIIYYFNNTTYFGWENIKKAAIQSALQFDTNGVPTTDEAGNLTGVRRSSSLYLAVFGDGCMGKFTWGTTEYDDSPAGMAIDQNSTNALYEVYSKDKTDTENRAAFKSAVVKELITIYESSKDDKDGAGYYFYYYYKNRHNDNLDNGSMGPMEFATVRNNIYKLSVNSISSLGHPRIPENDPDKPTPDTPDESDDLYITVNCRVIPWVVRINSIDF